MVNSARAATPTVIYGTSFEVNEGFDPRLTLIGQGGWVGFGEGGNGIVTNFFQDFGQQAFIGFTSPGKATNDFLNVWRPVNYVPPAATPPLVRFGVLMQIVPSTNASTDDFRWSVYNTNGARLFTVDFETSSRAISYALDDPATFVRTTNQFELNGIYDLTIWMDFGRNQWTALLDDTVIVNSQPISRGGNALNLGDVDAVWAVRTPTAPGSNFMVFDDYFIETSGRTSIPATVHPVGRGANGAFIVRVYGQGGLNYALDTSTDLVNWETQRIFKAPLTGVFDYEDLNASSTTQRFFRVRQVP